ncbi:TetR/AcrR family transcriptional regulator [Mycobacterium yunnanensis]|uniref:TetR/AcrR family transcriptional regulator n=1 Tax=Mycobacterium yunnanensis TaxID=368477 RepID=A0A9X2Z171_9MYCO|nr:TetR/AcrR family transcriptional regulator [Mycobacterium yunnanensis]MCV7421529.1 TetR/AcrR family transcriptional regulator [Mycobacterium yunnanensis]
MQESEDAAISRVQRRKQRTRSALIAAAQGFIADGRLNVPVLDITQAADVGMGSFYNHFDSKEELFAAAVGEALDAHGALLDVLTAEIEDPAETFGCRFRLTGRLFRRRPRESQILLANGVALLTSDRGLAPRALRDIEAAVAAGRFSVADPQLALAIAGGAIMGLGALLSNDPDRDDAEAADAVTADVLRLFGMSAADAADVCARPLPDLDVVAPAHPAA